MKVAYSTGYCVDLGHFHTEVHARFTLCHTVGLCVLSSREFFLQKSPRVALTGQSYVKV